MDEYISISDLAKKLGVTRQAVFLAVKEGRIRAVRFSSKTTLIPREEAKKVYAYKAKKYTRIIVSR